MGHLVNPISFRLSISSYWKFNSLNYYNKSYNYFSIYFYDILLYKFVNWLFNYRWIGGLFLKLFKNVFNKKVRLNKKLKRLSLRRRISRKRFRVFFKFIFRLFLVLNNKYNIYRDKINKRKNFSYVRKQLSRKRTRIFLKSFRKTKIFLLKKKIYFYKKKRFKLFIFCKNKFLLRKKRKQIYLKSRKKIELKKKNTQLLSFMRKRLNTSSYTNKFRTPSLKIKLNPSDINPFKFKSNYKIKISENPIVTDI
jgi:hypothetical protein